MISLLSKWFIPNRDNTSDPAVRRAYGQLCGIVGIVLNILLFLGKFIAGRVSGSIAITADAFNNLSDAGSSVVTLLGFRLGGLKPDRNHPFGHGRFEYISGLVVSALILLMGVELARSSFQKIFHPTEVEVNGLAVTVLLVSIAVKLYMTFYNRVIGKKINSAAMAATGVDSFSDTMATLAVLVAMAVSHFTHLMIDGWVGMLVAVFILVSAWKAALETLNPLLGQAPAPELVEHIRELVMAHGQVCGIHDLVVHDYGPGRMMISLHAEVPSDGNILEMHDVIDGIEMELEEELGCEAVIHMDPIVTNDTETIKMRDRVVELVQEVEADATIHDFRMVTGPTHTNLIFDVSVPFGGGKSEAAIEEEIRTRVRLLPGNYYAVVRVEHAYIDV